MGKKTRKAIKKLTEAVEELREQNEELSRRLTGALENQSEEIQALARTLGSRVDTPVPDDEADDVPGHGEESEATEAAERKAEELDVDLSKLKGTGAEGRILVKDVEDAAEAGD